MGAGILQEAVTLEGMDIDRDGPARSTQSTRERYRIMAKRIPPGDQQMDGQPSPRASDAIENGLCPKLRLVASQ